MSELNLQRSIDNVKRRDPHYAPLLDKLPFIVDHCDLGYEVTTGIKLKYSFCVSDRYAGDEQLIESHILRCCHECNDGLWKILQPVFTYNRHAQLKPLHTDTNTPIDVVIAPFHNSKNVICLTPSTYINMQSEDRSQYKLYELTMY